MSKNPADDLLDILAFHVTGQGWDPKNWHPDYPLLEFLIERVENMEQAVETPESVSRVFRKYQDKYPNFSYDLWYADQIESGVYDEPYEID